MAFDPDRREQDRRRERRREAAGREEARRFKAAVQDVMRQPAARLLFAEFFEAMGLDESAFNTNAMAQSRMIGRQEGARWWIEAIRAACPEQEVAIRVDWASHQRLQQQVIENDRTPNEGDDPEQ